MKKKKIPKKKTAKKKLNKTRVINKLPPKLKITKNGIETLPQVEDKPLRFDSKKYVKIAETESIEKFKELGERVNKKELKWIYYTTENNVGIHYYLILNTQK
jgi:hypothetical protein